MQMRIELFQDGEEVRLRANTAQEVKAALFDLIFRGVVAPGDCGVTMNTAVVGRFDAGDGADDLASEIEQVLENEGYKVV